MTFEESFVDIMLVVLGIYCGAKYGIKFWKKKKEKGEDDGQSSSK